MTDEAGRQDRLLDLAQLRRPVVDAVGSVRELPWDSEHEFVDLGVADVLRVLDRADAGLLTAADVEAWADAIEGRDDIRVTADARDFVFAAANPELAGSVLDDMARWRARLGAAIDDA